MLFTGLLCLLLSCGGPRAGSGVPDAPPAPENLPGNYSMKMVLDGHTHYSTAVVKQSVDGRFQISRITVYGPVFYYFSMDENARVISDELGSGKAIYQSNIHKTTILFENKGAICELTR